jgi:hypothetical protein
MKFNQETISTLGSIKLASGAITDPVEFVDVQLPGGYFIFTLYFSGFRFDVLDDYVALGFSYDGGETFLCDTENFDTYVYSLLAFFDNQDTLLTRAALNISDTLIEPFHLYAGGFGPGAGPQGMFYLTFTPGSSSDLTMGEMRGYSFPDVGMVGGDAMQTLSLVGLNPFATIPPTPARATTMRILPDGNGDINPPTSGNRIIAGTYTLFGVPTP